MKRKSIKKRKSDFFFFRFPPRKKNIWQKKNFSQTFIRPRKKNVEKQKIRFFFLRCLSSYHIYFLVEKKNEFLEMNEINVFFSSKFFHPRNEILNFWIFFPVFSSLKKNKYQNSQFLNDVFPHMKIVFFHTVPVSYMKRKSIKRENLNSFSDLSLPRKENDFLEINSFVPKFYSS